MKINLWKEQKLNENQLDQFIKADMNVLLIGEKGCGKSERIIQLFGKSFKNYAYIAGSTCDPWTDVVGIPVPTMVGGISVIKYARPETIPDDVEAIFIDEFNRAPKKVKNALMELIQFKSINGRKYPNLKVVWAAVNPWSDEGESDYDVERLDPAHIDRFHAILRVSPEPDIKYFTATYGNEGKDAVIWWRQQGEDARKTISARRLSYAVESFKKKVDLKFILPANSNVEVLVKTLGMDEHERWYDAFNIKYAKHLADMGKVPAPLAEIKEIAEPGEKHNRFFEKSTVLKGFFDYSQVFLTAEQKNAYTSKGLDKGKSIASNSKYAKVSDLNGKRVCLTGTHPSPTLDRYSLEQALRKAGASPVSNVTKTTDVLISFDGDNTSTKCSNAQKLGTLIVDGMTIDFTK